MKILLCLVAVTALYSAPFLQAKQGSPQKPLKEHTTEKSKDKKNTATSAQLTSEEQAQLNAAISKAAKDPEVIKAKQDLEKLQKASPQDVKAIAQANRHLEQVARSATIKADPKVASLFNKQEIAKKG
ncbi:MAG: hypothetical protein LBV12_02680, partial [Puniceicoccales bacterium]|nr:hypothetical protein [Puniceicoccales bacterium]